MSVEMMNTIDLVFALGFTFELIIRRGFAGSWSTFFWTHEDSSWHIFDSVVVGLSLVSFVIAAIGADDGGSGLQVKGKSRPHITIAGSNSMIN